MIFGSPANLQSIGHNWAGDNCHVAMLQTSSSKSKLLKAGGEFQVHNVLKSLYNGGTLCPTDACFKNSFLSDTSGPNINLDLIFFRVGKKPFKTHRKEADWPLSSLTSLIHFDSFLRLRVRYWNLLYKAFFHFAFLHFFPTLICLYILKV